MKKTLAFLLSLLLLFSVVSLSPAAVLDKNAYDFILEALYNGEEEIDIEVFELSPSELKKTVTAIVRNEPMLFYFEGGYSYSFYQENRVLTLEPKYSLVGNARETAVEYVNKTLDAVIATVPSRLDDYEKALYLHDFICVSFEYDTDYAVSDIYGMLMEGRGVCTAYALLYDELLTRVGIESRAVISPKESLNHMWNEVKIDGKWYYVDVTWDDPLPDRFGEALHDNFLICETCLEKTHDGVYDTEFPCDECFRNEREWGHINFPIVYADGKLYSERYGVIAVVSLYEDELIDLFVAEDHGWYSTDGKYLGFCMGIGAFDDLLFYNTAAEIIVYAPHTGEKQSFYTANKSEGMLIGLYVVGDMLYYLVSPTGHAKDGSVHSIKLDKNALPDPGLNPNPNPKPDPDPDNGEKAVGGDANGDGKLDPYDYIYVRRAYFGTIELETDDRARCDVNGDGAINQYDYVLVRRAYLGTYVFE